MNKQIKKSDNANLVEFRKSRGSEGISSMYVFRVTTAYYTLVLYLGKLNFKSCSLGMERQMS